jgi:GNAT superfamily N-acetyltransferase
MERSARAIAALLVLERGRPNPRCFPRAGGSSWLIRFPARVGSGQRVTAPPVGDEFHFDKSPEFIDRAVIKARREEDESNTFAGMALERVPGLAHDRKRGIVGLHILRRFEEGPLIGAHIAGLWVAEHRRRQGVARRLKAMGESWARGIGASFLNSNVLVHNEPMLKLNRDLGFVDYRINLRKRL